MTVRTIAALLLFLVLNGSGYAAAQVSQADYDSHLESLRADMRADKIAIITEAMQFSDQESTIFWPVYRKYETDLIKVNDQRLTLIKSYADKFASMSDADAKTMIEQSISFESQRTSIKRKYAKEFQKAGLSPLTVAKFLQLEHRLDLVVDTQIASQLPSLLIKPTGSPAPHE